MIASIGVDTGLHPDFGSGLYDGQPIGIPFDVVSRSTPRSHVSFDYSDVHAIADQVDVLSMISENQRRDGGEVEYGGRGGTEAGWGRDAIDDLFEMDGPMRGELSE